MPAFASHAVHEAIRLSAGFHAAAKVETLARAYGECAFSILPRSFLLPEGYWAWRLWRERCAADQARRPAAVAATVSGQCAVVVVDKARCGANVDGCSRTPYTVTADRKTVIPCPVMCPVCKPATHNELWIRERGSRRRACACIVSSTGYQRRCA